MSKRPTWTYAGFKVGDVFVGKRHANKDFFVLTSLDDGFTATARSSSALSSLLSTTR